MGDLRVDCGTEVELGALIAEDGALAVLVGALVLLLATFEVVLEVFALVLDVLAVVIEIFVVALEGLLDAADDLTAMAAGTAGTGLPPTTPAAQALSLTCRPEVVMGLQPGNASKGPSSSSTNAGWPKQLAPWMLLLKVTPLQSPTSCE